MPDAFWHPWVQALLPGSAVPLAFTHRLFWAFFTLFLAVYALAARHRHTRSLWLSLGGLYLYAQLGGMVDLPGLPWRVAPVLLLVLLACHDFATAHLLHRQKSLAARRALLLASVAANLGVLAWLKYALFWQSLVQGQWLSVQTLEVVGLSYFVFKSLSHVLDVYYERVDQPARNLLEYIAYLSFLPTLVAGPIHRFGAFQAQLHAPWHLSKAQAGLALWLVVVGLAKKLVLADALGSNYVDRIFGAPEMYTGLEVLLAGAAFGLQLFLDFGGYTDVALGLALALGFGLTHNFNEPFKALSLSDFWRRWHISLSSWFNDYVFTPLSFAWRRAKRWGQAAAIVVTFLLSGLWHGPNLTFVLWGLAHGLVLGGELALRSQRQRWAQRRGYGVLAGLALGAFLVLTFILFRAADLATAAQLYARIFTDFNPGLLPQWLSGYATVALAMLAALLLVFAPTRLKRGLEARWLRLPLAVQAVLAALALVGVVHLQAAEGQAFIYLKF